MVTYSHGRKSARLGPQTSSVVKLLVWVRKFRKVKTTGACTHYNLRQQVFDDALNRGDNLQFSWQRFENFNAIPKLGNPE